MENETVPDAAKAPEKPALHGMDLCIPLLALALSWLFWYFFFSPALAWPYLGAALYTLAHFACVLVVLGKRAVWSRESIFLLVCSLLLALSCALWSNDVFFLLNCFLILLVAAMATFSLAGRLDASRGSAPWRTIWLSLAAFLTRIHRPFQVLATLLAGTGRKKIFLAAAGLLLGSGVIALVLWLLASADAVFGSFFRPLSLSVNLVQVALRLLTALCLASALYMIREKADHPEKQSRPLSLSWLTLPLVLTTGVLNILYGIFCLIQIRYLFGGASAAAMAGGWAEYARSGFFQLVAVAAINLGLCLAGACGNCLQAPGGKMLRVLDVLLLFFSAFILASAFWRMRLYMHVFGLSILRLEVLWAMAVIALGLLAAGRKLFRPRFRFFPAAAGAALALWCLLCLAGPGRLIADYNVDHYLSGQLEQVDVGYLERLNQDALPALRRLQEQAPAYRESAGTAARRLTNSLVREAPWYCQSLSSRRAIR